MLFFPLGYLLEPVAVIGSKTRGVLDHKMPGSKLLEDFVGLC